MNKLDEQEVLKIIADLKIWANSDAGKAAMKSAKRNAEASKKQIRKARKIDPLKLFRVIGGR